MKIETEREGHLADQTVALLQHKGQELKWNIKLIDKASIAPGLDIFHQINGFWANMNIEAQDKVFEIYGRIHRTFDEVWETTELARALLPLVAELCEQHQLDDVRHWMNLKSDIRLPHKLDEEFTESQGVTARDRTYLREDYKDLVVLSIILRPMLLVWGEYIFRTEKEHGTNWKEYKAFELLGQAYVLDDEKCPPMARLRKYVELSLPTVKEFDSAILDGLSTEEFPTWILALVVIRRLAIGDISGVDPDFSLVAFIYRYVGQKVKGHDNSFMGMVKPKIPESQTGDNENNLSKLEGYKVKQEIPAGDIAVIEHYISSFMVPAVRVEPELANRMDLLNESLKSAQQLGTEHLWDPQISIAQIVLAGAISPRAFPYLSKKTVLEAVAIAQAVLWHQKHYALATLMTAIAQEDSEELQLTGVIPQSRIPPTSVTILNELYPHARRPQGKQKTQKERNVAMIGIDMIAKQLREHEWRATIPQSWMAEIQALPEGERFLRNNDRRFAVPYDIRIKLADMSIQVATKAKEMRDSIRGQLLANPADIKL